MGDSILNGVIERNLSNDSQFLIYVIYLIIHAGTNDAVKFTSRDILNKLPHLKSFIQENYLMQK